MEPTPELARKIALFRAHGRIVREHEELFTEAGWLQVMLGQGVESESWSPLAEALSEEELRGFLHDLKRLVHHTADELGRHEDFIAQIGAGGGD